MQTSCHGRLIVSTATFYLCRTFVLTCREIIKFTLTFGYLDCDATMSRGICPRVNFCWIWLAVLFLLKIEDVGAYSCHEVKTAFQVRQIGPLKWVPETPGTDVDLLVCKHQGPSCCTRKMEESYQAAVRRETLQSVRSYSFELKYLISGHATAFQDTFQYLLSFSQGHLSSLLEDTYSPLSREALPHVNSLFSSLSLYIRGHNLSLEAAVDRFHDNLFPLVYGRLVNPGVGIEGGLSGERGECLRATRQDVNPFGPHPETLAQELGRTLGAGRALSLALAEGTEVMNATEHVSFTKECLRGLTKMQYCSHCRGLTLIKPCVGYCLNVMRGCLASVAELDGPWRRYVAALEELTNAVAGQHSLELALLGVRGHVNEAILHAQLHGPTLTATVDKVCGLSAKEPRTSVSTSSHPDPTPEVTTSMVTSSTVPPSVPPSIPPLEQLMGQPAHLRREFLSYIQRYKSFFAVLPEMLCEGEMVVEDFTCWSGDDVVESYTGRVVGNGLQAQKQNPEVKVRSPNPELAEVKERLERLNQEIHDMLPGLVQRESWGELGSGDTEDGSGDCDDEDGCQGSGTGTVRSSPDGRPEVSSDKPVGTNPGGRAPPVVRVRGAGCPPACLSLPTALTLLLVTLALQWSML
ncbi:glypican-5 isoform X2 [Coregonus clupeaformis]|uniref:glypican-5 isoform X2 n=1 Tax=Coregonus clupeaformis TaxID=59861 RepID=UPI001E1C97F0|nr:glypican-5 isoform X2 [Coregonus clupeaformis]